jgi:hypothetical protein
MELRLVYTATDTDLKKTVGQTRYENNGGRIFGRHEPETIR